MRALLVGHFSTFGDLEVLHQVEHHLTVAGLPYDVGAYSTRLSAELPRGVNIYAVEPADYTHVLVVCGPFNPDYLVQRGLDLDRFRHCVRIGVNLSMIRPLGEYDPLDAMIGRDSDQWTHPDLAFAEEVARRPVAGLCLVERQNEYGDRQRHEKATDMLRRLGDRAGLAIIELDTEWPATDNKGGLSSPEQFESICARLDVMLTTRLHGMVLALKNGIPTVALDAISGGGKVARQAREIGWPEHFLIDAVDDNALDLSLSRCLSAPARQLARDVASAARLRLSGFSPALTAALNTAPAGRPTGTAKRGLAQRLAEIPLLAKLRSQRRS